MAFGGGEVRGGSNRFFSLPCLIKLLKHEDVRVRSSSVDDKHEWRYTSDLSYAFTPFIAQVQIQFTLQIRSVP